MQSNKIDLIIACNLLSLAVVSAGYGMSVISDIPAMRSAIAGERLVPMPEPIEFVTECNEIVTSQGVDYCADGQEYAPIDVELYLPIVVAKDGE
jgi:hypothetical protein